MRLRETNHAVVNISHNLKDVFEIAASICVMRRGGNVGTFWADEITADEIVVTMTTGLDDTANHAA